MNFDIKDIVKKLFDPNSNFVLIPIVVLIMLALLFSSIGLEAFTGVFGIAAIVLIVVTVLNRRKVKQGKFGDTSAMMTQIADRSMPMKKSSGNSVVIAANKIEAGMLPVFPISPLTSTP